MSNFWKRRKKRVFLGKIVNLFLSADFHFGHFNCIRYCGRPFTTSQEMDEQIVANVNKIVGEKDLLWFLGDFAFVKTAEQAETYRKRIRCKNIRLVLGNHDRLKILKSSFPEICSLVDFRYDNVNFVFCHYAMRVWNRSHYSSVHCFAHSHGTLTDDPNSLSFDIGIDAVAKRLAKENNTPILPEYYRPVSYDEVKKWMATKTFKPIDHHGGG